MWNTVGCGCSFGNTALRNVEVTMLEKSQKKMRGIICLCSWKSWDYRPWH